MKVLELFAGIGGIGLGLERTGEFKVHWQVEIEPYAQKVLQKHWPDAYLHDDVKTFPPADLHCDADVIAGGFPCQDISTAGRGEGLEGERSGLFFEVVRIAKEIKPRWILLENVAALLVRGLDRVLIALAEIGYDAQWHCVPASAVGAPHRRNRIFILAYPHSDDRRRRYSPKSHSGKTRLEPRRSGKRQLKQETHSALADSNGIRREGVPEKQVFRFQDVSREFMRGRENLRRFWAVEPDVGRVAYGVPRRLDRLRCLGNAVVPQVAQVLGEYILFLQNELNQGR